MKTKNVMLLIHSLTIGGTERSVGNISKLLCERHNVFVAVFNAKSAETDICGRLLDLRQPMGVWWRKPLVAARRVVSLRRTVREYQIDLLFGFTSVGCRYLAFVPKTTKRVLCSRGFWDIVRHEAFYTLFLHKFDGLLFNSVASRHWFVKRHEGLARKTFSLQNCIDINEIEQKAKAPPDEAFARFASGRVVIISVGRLYDVKGFDFLIKAFLLLQNELSDTGLVIVGDGPSRGMLQKLAEPGGGGILFTGTRSNPFPYMAASSLYVLPSRAEGFPNALVEAMACGVPVIAANCESGPNEILNESYDPSFHAADVVRARYGIITPQTTMPPDDCPDHLESAHFHLADAMKAMLLDKALREKYQRASLQRARHFSFENSMARYTDFIDAMADQGAKKEA